jgi:hypothetical protein
MKLEKSKSFISKEKDLNPPFPSTEISPSLIPILNQTLSC